MAGITSAALGTNAGIGLTTGGFDYNEAYTGKNPVKDFLGENTYEDVRTISNIVSGETVIAGASGVQAIEDARRADEIGKISQNANGLNGEYDTKPNQVHHYATNKNKTYTPQLEEIAQKYEVDLDNLWNKDLLPHQGRHPNEYHEYVLDSMKQFDETAQGNKDVFLKLFENLKENIRSNPDMLYKNYWK